MTQVHFVIPGEPHGKGRPRAVRVGTGVRMFTPKQTVNYENLIKMSYYQQLGQKKLNGAIEADITGMFPIPKSESKKKRGLMLDGEIHHTKKIDCDNLAKTVLDALNGIAYDDDKQVFRLNVEKVYSETPCVDVVLKEVAEQ